MAEQRTSEEVFVARNAERERAAGSPAAAFTRSEQSGRPDGCYGQSLEGGSGAVRVLEVCPGLGGYRGLAGESFGISTLVLRDPVTGEPVVTEDGQQVTVQQVVTVDPLALAQQAAAELDLPDPDIRMSPDGEQVVQLASWLWVPAGQWEPRQASASAGPVTATVTATPVRMTWDMGDGDRVTCDGPGAPYQGGAAQTTAAGCRHTYQRSSASQPGAAYDVTATIEWELAWTAIGAPGGGALGTVPTATTTAVQVAEVQALVQ